jgi:hypothetical protein
MPKRKTNFVTTSTILLDNKQKFNLFSTDRAAQTPVPLAKFFHHKPQIVSIPGVSPKDRFRYRVILGNQILGTKLTLDEALKVAKGGKA